MPAKIEHFFVLMLENRSYDSVFGFSDLAGTTPAGEATTANGLPAMPIVNFGRTGTAYQLGKGAPYALGFDPGHECVGDTHGASPWLVGLETNRMTCLVLVG